MDPLFTDIVEYYVDTISPFLSSGHSWVSQYVDESLQTLSVMALIAGTTIAAIRKLPRKPVLPLALSAAALAYVGQALLPYFRQPLEEKFPEAAFTTQQSVKDFYYYAFLELPPATPPSRQEQHRLLEQSLGRVVAAFGDQSPRLAPPSNSLSMRAFLPEDRKGLTSHIFHSYIIEENMSEAHTILTHAHEMAHVALYTRESEATVLGLLTLLNAEDPFLHACGLRQRLLLEGCDFVPAWFFPYTEKGDSSPRVSTLAASVYGAAHDRVFAARFGSIQKEYVDRSRLLIGDLESRIGYEGVCSLSHANP
jgi:hypothetical protein